MMPIPFLQIGGCQSGWGLLTGLATRMVFPHSKHAKGSSCYCLLGRVQALWTDQNHLHICCQPKASPWLGIPGSMGQVWVGIPNPLAQAVTSLSDHPMPPCLPRRTGKSHWPQCSGCPQMLPAALSMMGLGTGVSS